MQINKKLLLIPVFSIFIFAAVPTNIIYQGYISKSGLPAQGPVSFTFTLSPGIWPSYSTNITVKDGIYTAELPIPVSALNPTTTYTLQIDADSTTLTPNVGLNSVPYAYYAASLDGIVNVINSNVGIGTLSPQAKLDVYDEMRTTILSLKPVVGHPAILMNASRDSKYLANYSAFQLWHDVSSHILRLRTANPGVADSAISWSDGLAINTNGNVGIATGYPTAPLDVRGTPGNPASSGVLQPNISLRLGTDTGNSQVLDMGIFNDPPFGAWLQAANSGALDQSSPIALNPNGGNIGIGTAAPDAKLEVNGFTKLGSDAPKIKMKKLTGTTSAAQGSSVSVSHGLTSSKILSVTLLVEYSPGLFVSANYAFAAGFTVSFAVDATLIHIQNHASSSYAVLSKPFKLSICYEE